MYVYFCLVDVISRRNVRIEFLRARSCVEEEAFRFEGSMFDLSRIRYTKD